MRSFRFLVAALAVSLPSLVQADAVKEIELIGSAQLPAEHALDGAPVVGISGLVRLGDEDLYAAISDDTSDSLFYIVRVEIPTDLSAPVGFEFVERRRFANPDAEDGRFAADSLDPEGITYDRQNNVLLWASESMGGTNTPTFIHINALDGSYLGEVPVDAKYDHTVGQGADGAPTQGVFASAGFESLTISPDGAVLFAAPEDALVQDGTPTKAGDGAEGLARIIAYERDGESWAPTREFAYPVSAREDTTAGEGTNSLVDLLAIDGTTLLALEREWPDSPGVTPVSRNVKLFEVSLDGATDVAAADALEGAEFDPVSKRLVLDFDMIRDADNGVDGVLSHEALVFGPTLDDGRRTLIMINDNDGSRDHQLLVFALTLE